MSRIKFIAELNPSKSQLDHLDSLTRVTFLPMEAIGENGELDLSRKRYLKDVRNGYTYLGEGDVCIAKITPCFENGKGAVISGTHNGIAFATTEVIPFRCKRAEDARFLYFLLTSAPFKPNAEASMYGAGGQKRVADSFVGNYSVVLPPPEERSQIAKFLDYETAKIDALIAKQQQLIALLQEKRQAVISHAVTKGLNPAAPLRDSGVAWLGEVPAHWEVRKLKHISDKLQGRLVVQPHLYFADEGVPIVFGYNIKNGKINEEGVSRISFSADKQHSHAKARAGDIYTVRVGEPGATAVVPKSLDGCHFASIMWIHQHQRFISEWLSHCMNSDIIRRQIEVVNYGAAQTQFNISDALNFILPFPPIAEQQAIAKFLDGRLAANDYQVERAEEMKELLQERRTALIAAAVTGKIDVRGWHPPPAAARETT